MEKSFEFIDSTKNDRLTKRLVRSHAMKGKNAGKTLARSSRLDLSRQLKCRQVALVRNAKSRNDEENRNAPIRASLGLTYMGLGDKLLSISFPVEITSQNQHVINQCQCFALYEGCYLHQQSLRWSCTPCILRSCASR